MENNKKEIIQEIINEINNMQYDLIKQQYERHSQSEDNIIQIKMKQIEDIIYLFTKRCILSNNAL